MGSVAEQPRVEVVGPAGQPELEGLAHQLDLWTDETPGAKLAMVGPLGCGKTLGLCVKVALLASANRESSGMVVVPTYPLARMVHIPEWPDIMARLGVPLRFESQSSCFVWPWGHRTWLRTGERPARLAGPNLAYVAIDEPGQQEREVWDRASVRVRDPKARLRQTVLGGTPEGINWFADLFASPDESAGFRTIWAREWHPSMRHYPADLVNTYAYDESLLAAYGEGKFVPLRVGRCYPPFSRPVHQDRALRYEPGLPLVLACDFNVDAMRWLVMQVTGREIRVLDEIALGRSASTEGSAKAFVERWGGRHSGPVTVCGDRSGGSRTTSSSKTDYLVLGEELKRSKAFAAIWKRVPASNPLVKDRVATVNYHLAARGNRVVRIHPRVKELQLDLERVSWSEGRAVEDQSDPMRTHAAAAFGYALWVLARPSTIGTRTTHGTVRPAASGPANPVFERW